MSCHAQYDEGRFTFTCDGCGHSKVIFADSLQEASGALKQDGWGIYQFRGDWKHNCPDCD